MSCNQPNHSVITLGEGSNRILFDDLEETGGPILIVSNAPESLFDYSGEPSGAPPPHGDYETLYKCAIALSANTPQSFRLFLWHANENLGDLTIGIGLSTSDSNANVTNRKLQGGVVALTGNDMRTLGICIAKAQIDQSLDSAAGSDPSITYPFETELAIWSVANNQMIGALYQFTVTSSSNTNLTIRTYFARGSTIGSPSDDVTDPRNRHINEDDQYAVHIRGWWPYSEILVSEDTSYDTNCDESDDPRFYELGQEGSAEVLAFAHQSSGDPHGTSAGNKGLYGANVTYRTILANSDTVNMHAGYYLLVGRGTGAGYFGATRFLPSYPLITTLGVPRIVNENNAVTGIHFGTKIVAVNGSASVDFTWAHAGSSALPVDLEITCIAPTIP